MLHTQAHESSVGATLKRLREERALSIEDLSQLLKDSRKPVDPKTIERIEKGSTKPRGETLRRLAEGLGIEVGVLTKAEEAQATAGPVAPSDGLAEWIEASSRMVRVPLVRVTRPGDLTPAFPAFSQVNLKPEDLTEEQEDAAAAAFQVLADALSLWSDLGPLKQRELLKDAFADLADLEEVGLALGVGRRTMTALSKGMDWDQRVEVAVFRIEHSDKFSGEWWVPANEGIWVG